MTWTNERQRQVTRELATAAVAESRNLAAIGLQLATIRDSLRDLNNRTDNKDTDQ